jgi:hypothetical protein
MDVIKDVVRNRSQFKADIGFMRLGNIPHDVKVFYLLLKAECGIKNYCYTSRDKLLEYMGYSKKSKANFASWIKALQFLELVTIKTPDKLSEQDVTKEDYDKAKQQNEHKYIYFIKEIDTRLFNQLKIITKQEIKKIMEQSKDKNQQDEVNSWHYL